MILYSLVTYERLLIYDYFLFHYSFIIVCTTSRSYTVDDLISTVSQGGVEATSLRFFSDRRNRHLQPASGKPDPFELDAQRTSLVLSGVNFHIGTPMQEKKELLQAKPQRDRTSSLSTITEISNLDKKKVEDELTFPQKHSSKKLLESKKEEKSGVDNPAYSNIEEEAVVPNEASKSELVLSPSNLVVKEEPEETSP